MRLIRQIAVLASLFTVLLASSLFAQTLTVKVPQGNVRSGPGTTFDIAGTVKRGEKYQVQEQQGDWFKILLETGREGWVFRSLVEVAGAAPTRSVSVVPSSPAVKGKTLYSNSWAVVIGINRYRNSKVKPLEYAVNDATSVRDSLTRLGFPSGQIFALTEGQATKEAIEEMLGDRLRKLAGPEDRVFIFFAGHGMTERVTGGEEGYLLPVEADPDRLYSTAISMTSLKQISRRLRAKHVLFAVDACYSGYAIYTTRGISNPDLVDELTRKPSVQILTAGRSGDLAQEREGHGLFTKVLLRGLGGEADHRQWGWVALDHLGTYVRDRVYAESGQAQLPQFGNLSGEGQFVFVLPGEGVGAQHAAPLQLERERARLEEDRRKLEAEKTRLERDRLSAERKRLEEERKRLEEERKRIADVGAGLRTRPQDVGAGPRPGPQPPAGPQVAVAPGLPHEIGSGLQTMVLVPAGWFIRGSTPEEAEKAFQEAKKFYSGAKKEWYDREVPQRRVWLDAFYIDKYPVTNAEFRRFERPSQDYGEKYNGDRQPVVGVTWSQARDYCQSVGKRLPTEAEWEKAARGVDGRKYPWGNDWNPSKLIWGKNSGYRTHPVDRTYNTHRSPYGAVDMAGNVDQWVADWYDWNYHRNAPERNPQGPSSGRERVSRGGEWIGSDTTNYRAIARRSTQAMHWHWNLGFRCAKAP